MNRTEEMLQAQLFAMQDLKYREFQCKLMPTVEKERVIGVRTPQLRLFAKEFAAASDAADFLRRLPHRYYEENNLHGFLIERIKNYDDCITALDAFLPYIDNWATCDIISPKIFKKHLPALREKIDEWLSSDHTYTIRFGIEMLMSFFLEDHFTKNDPDAVSALRSEEYYVNMMIAWYFATALAKQYDAVLPYLEQQRLSPWTHNKAIRKAIESYRITDEQKAYLRILKRNDDKEKT